MQLLVNEYFQKMFDALSDCKVTCLTNLEQLRIHQCMLLKNTSVIFFIAEKFTECMDNAATLHELVLLAKAVIVHAQSIDIGWKHFVVAKFEVIQ